MNQLEANNLCRQLEELGYITDIDPGRNFDGTLFVDFFLKREDEDVYGSMCSFTEFEDVGGLLEVEKLRIVQDLENNL